MTLAAAVVAFLIFIIGACAWLDEKQWAAFSRTNACKVVGHTSGSTAVVFASNGTLGTAYVAGKTADGVTYWR